MFWKLILTVVAAEASAVYYLKKYSNSSNLYFFLISMLLYTLYAFALGKLFTKKKIVISQAITGMMSLLLLSLLGLYLHNEKLEYKEMLGLGVAILAIIILI
jgi:multidrug transporter EmrE-like cation transporter